MFMIKLLMHHNEITMITMGLIVVYLIYLPEISVIYDCFLTRFMHQAFSNNYKATIGVDFEVERFDVLETPFNLQM